LYSVVTPKKKVVRAKHFLCTKNDVQLVTDDVCWGVKIRLHMISIVYECRS